MILLSVEARLALREQSLAFQCEVVESYEQLAFELPPGGNVVRCRDKRGLNRLRRRTSNDLIIYATARAFAVPRAESKSNRYNCPHDHNI